MRIIHLLFSIRPSLRRKTYVLGLLALCFFNNAQAIELSDVQNAIRKTDASIQASVAKKRIPGCAIAVVFRNQIIFMNGYGARSIGKPEKIDPDTVFQLGSVSKPIAATLASLLEEQGILSLDDPVSYYLPKFSLNNNQSPNTLKVKNILSHTSGLPRSGFNHLIETFTPYSDILSTLQKTRVSTVPGRHYDYHNAMYGLIANVIKAATFQSFSKTLYSTLLNPLHMQNTSVTLEGLFRTTNRASPHTLNQKGVLSNCEPYSQGYYSVAPAGGINSSARDMAIFLKAQMGGFPGVLPAKALVRMQTPFVSTNNSLKSPYSKNASYGLGWRIADYANHKLVFHGGWLKGFTNFLGFMPDEQLGIVILHNGDTKFSSKTAIQFLNMAMGLPDVSEVPTKTQKLKRNGKKGKANKLNGLTTKSLKHKINHLNALTTSKSKHTVNRKKRSTLHLSQKPRAKGIVKKSPVVKKNTVAKKASVTKQAKKARHT